jgi:hypothetical protein
MQHGSFSVWFMTALSVLYGLWLALRMPATEEKMTRCVRVDDPALEGRVASVVAARSGVDAIPPWVGWFSGAAWIALSPFVAMRAIGPGLAYGIGCLAFASCLAAAYLQGRNRARRRAAVLAPRKVGGRIPSVWYVVAVLNAVAVLSFATVPGLGLAAILVVASTLAAVGLALRVSATPAVLFGDDLPVEQAFDDRVRFARTSSLLTLAFVQPFVFCGFSLAYTDRVFAPLVVGLTLTVAAAYSVWFVTRTFAPIGAKDVAAVVSASQ